MAVKEMKERVKEKVTAKDINGNELEEGDRVLVVDTGSMSKLWQNAVGTVMALRTVDDETIQCRVKLDGNSGVNPKWHPNQLRKITTEIVEVSRLDELAGEIKGLHQECEGAIEVAQKAEQSALLSAIECGARLLEAKAICKTEGKKWEQWRDEHIGIPSSTATLYQRIFASRDDLEAQGIQSVRQAREALKSDRQISAAKSRSKSATKSVTVADLPATQSIDQMSDSSEHLAQAPSIDSKHLPEQFESECEVDPAIYGNGVTEETAKDLVNLGIEPYKPKISPEEFNREMAKAGLFAFNVRVINPRVKRCQFMSNGKIKEGVISGFLMNWDTMQASAVLIDHDTGQSQVPISKVWLIDEQGSASDQVVDRYAGVTELEARGWDWEMKTTKDRDNDLCYCVYITSPDLKKRFSARYYELLEDAIEFCIEQAKEAGVWEEAK